jgi:hypothetical protein
MNALATSAAKLSKTSRKAPDFCAVHVVLAPQGARARLESPLWLISRVSSIDFLRHLIAMNCKFAIDVEINFYNFID